MPHRAIDVLVAKLTRPSPVLPLDGAPCLVTPIISEENGVEMALTNMSGDYVQPFRNKVLVGLAMIV